MSNPPINERIKAVRKALKMSQKDFAKVLGLTQTSLSQLELGKHLPKYPVISNLINQLKVNPDYLFKSSETIFNSDFILADIAEKDTENKAYVVKGDEVSKVAEEEAFYRKRSKTEAIDRLLPYNIIPIVKMNELLESKPVIPSDLLSGSYIYLPQELIRKGIYRCVRIESDNFKPLVQKGDYAVIRLIDKTEWNQIPDGNLCFLGDIQNDIHVNRIMYPPDKKSGILYAYETDDEAEHTFYNFNEIEVVWLAEWYLSTSHSHLSSYDLRMSKIEKGLEELDKAFRKFKKGK